MLLKLKNDEVNIKGRGFVGGRKKKNWISKEDTSSPTVYTEGLMLSCIIDAIEGPDVANADLIVDFLQNDYNK